MAELCQEIGGTEEPLPVEISPSPMDSGALVILRRDIHKDEEGWTCQNITYYVPEIPEIEDIEAHFEELWELKMSEAGGLALNLARQQNDIILCDMYEDLQDTQDQYDSILCNLYEFLAN